jgi:acetate kinase
MSAQPVVLTVNAGSSSLRLGLYRGRELELVASWRGEDGSAESAAVEAAGIADWVRQQGVARPDVVAHRVVHGGADLVAPCRVNGMVEAVIERLAPLAPLHNPAALRGIRAVRTAWGPELLQVAVFDTGFYSELPAAAACYALPDLGPGEPLRRYGFHGIAHQAMLNAWRGAQPEAVAGARTISLQLGAGCSMTAAVGGKPVETSMGFTPLEGLVMASRSGDVDPGLLLYLLKERGHTVADLQRLLNHEAGLKGLSGITGDMRELLESPEPAAALAVEAYCHRLRKYLGAYLAVLGGAEAILFGGGVGENSPVIRKRVLTGLEFAGVRLDRTLNQTVTRPATAIHANDSAVAIWVVAVDEARELARTGLEWLGGRPCKP